MKKFIFYDTETTGLKELNYVQVIQIGSFITDEDFNDLGSFDLVCAPLPWTLVTPKALLVNKKAEIFNHPQTHYELITKVYETWSDWSSNGSSVFITYNGMRFDEEVMRRQFYWNLYDPFITNTKGNSRLDIYTKMLVIACFYQDVYALPEIDGKLSLKLEHLAQKLGLDTDNAHDALADCIFLKEVVFAIKKIAPNFYDEMMQTTAKTDLLQHLYDDELHFMCNYFPKSKTTKYYPFCLVNNGLSEANSQYIFDLTNDPKDLFNLTFNDLNYLLKSRNSPIKKINIARTAASISYKTLLKDNIRLENADLYQSRANALKENLALQEKILEIMIDQATSYPVGDYPEDQIYSGGFASAIDKDRMNKFHRAKDLSEKNKILDSFDDERYKDFAIRICGQLFPQQLSSDQLLHCKNIVNDRFNNQGPWPVAQVYIDEGNELLTKKLDKNEKKLVNLAINSIKSSQSF